MVHELTGEWVHFFDEGLHLFFRHPFEPRCECYIFLKMLHAVASYYNRRYGVGESKMKKGFQYVSYQGILDANPLK